MGCLSQVDFEVRLDKYLSGIVWVNPALDRLDINWVLDKSITEKLKCHFQSYLGTNNSGAARRVFINHCDIFRTFIHYSMSPKPTFKKSLRSGILTKRFSSRLWLTLKSFRPSFIPLVQAMTELCPCPTPVVSDSFPANSVTGAVEISFIPIAAGMASISTREKLILLFALQRFLFSLSFMFIQCSSYVLRIQIKTWFFSFSALQIPFALWDWSCLLLDIHIKNKFLDRSDFYKELCTSEC